MNAVAKIARVVGARWLAQYFIGSDVKQRIGKAAPRLSNKAIEFKPCWFVPWIWVWRRAIFTIRNGANHDPPARLFALKAIIAMLPIGEGGIIATLAQPVGAFPKDDDAADRCERVNVDWRTLGGLQNAIATHGNIDARQSMLSERGALHEQRWPTDGHP